MAQLLLLMFFILTAIGLPIGFMLGVTALIGFEKLGNPVFLTMLSQRFFSAMNSYTFLAIPLFFLAGDIMTKVGLTERIVSFANVFFGRLRGGLGQVNITTSILFGGISGSAAADTAALGSIFIPAMVKEGYSRGFSAAVTAASSIIAPIIPPSIIMVIYGGIMGVSIAGMFAAGIVPGLMIGVGLMIVNYFISRKRNYPKHDIPITTKLVIQEFRNAVWALIMPFIIMGGILGGVFTPTEAAAVAVAYALFLGLVVYRNLSLKDIYDMLYKNAVMMGMIILMISSASVLAWLLVIEKLPEQVATIFTSLSENKYIILLLINVLLILVGMLMDIVASLLILAPILAPLAIGLGVDPLHFGIMMCVNLNIALITPPMGGCLFIAMVVGEVSFHELIKSLWPFILVELVVLFLIVYIPPLTMFVPRALGF